MIRDENPSDQLDFCVALLTVCEDALTGDDPLHESLAWVVQSAHKGVADGVKRLTAAHKQEIENLHACYGRIKPVSRLEVK